MKIFLKYLKANIKNKLRAFRQVKFVTFNDNEPPILLYQMGKVGSSSIYRTLQQSGIKNPIYQVHYLSDDLTAQKIKHSKVGKFPYHLELGSALQKKIPKKRIKVKIISLVREPVSREISNFFQNHWFVSSDIYDERGIIDSKKAAEYLDKVLSAPHTFDDMFNWFDRELKSVFNIDIFTHNFNPEDGYLIINDENADVLIIRLEDLSEKGFKIISEFLELPFKLSPVTANIRLQSEHSESYKKVKKTIKLDPAVCEKIYESRFVRYFYSRNEISEFIQQWTK